MPQLELLDSGVIYRNPNPGYQYTFASHSHVTPLSGQELICTYQRGQALYSVDSVCAQLRSTDGGKTWTDEGLIHDPSGENRPYSYHSPVVSRMSNGTLVITAMRIDRSDPNQPLFNESTGGILETDTILLRSTDGGARWSAPRKLTVPEGLTLTPSCPIVELSNGRWFQPFDQWHAFDDPGPYRPRTMGLVSTDEGHTWGNPVTFADGAAGGKGFWHGRIIRLHDERLFTLFWSADLKVGKDLPLHSCMGSSDGREWTTPEPTNIPGQTNWPVDLGDGRMVAVYTVRESPPPGFFVTFSQDGGKTWNLDEQVMVWDATGRDKLGTHAPDSYPRSHDTIAYGAPTATRLLNGDVFISFWCTEKSITQIRFARLRLA